MSKPIVIALSALILASCAGFTAEVQSKAQVGADRAAEAFLADDCLITVGAYNRLPQTKRIAVDLLCGGNALRELQSLAR